MSFAKDKFVVIKQVISPELTDFIYKYFLMKRTTAYTLRKNNYFTDEKYYNLTGSWGDSQVPDAYSHYSDIVMETLLLKVHPIMEKITKLKLYPAYSYARIYNKGNVLKRHTDRFSCEISTTLNLGGDSWPIFLEPNKNVGISGVDGCTPSSNNPGVKINLEPGDMLIYSGCVLEHWRETFEGEVCGQVFLHYNNIKTSGEEYKFDKRPFLGLPNYYNQ